LDDAATLDAVDLESFDNEDIPLDDNKFENEEEEQNSRRRSLPRGTGDIQRSHGFF
jgi:hypothetical protein